VNDPVGMSDKRCKHDDNYVCWICAGPEAMDWTMNTVRAVRPAWESFHGPLPPLDPDPPHDCSDDNGGACDWDCHQVGDL